MTVVYTSYSVERPRDNYHFESYEQASVSLKNFMNLI